MDTTYWIADDPEYEFFKRVQFTGARIYNSKKIAKAGMILQIQAIHDKPGRLRANAQDIIIDVWMEKDKLKIHNSFDASMIFKLTLVIGHLLLF